MKELPESATLSGPHSEERRHRTKFALARDWGEEVYFLDMLCIELNICSVFTYFYWGRAALQCCVSFCCTAKWISCMYTHKGENESSSVMSDSLWPHGLYSPWNSTCQNTGVGSLSLLQGNLPNPGIEPRSLALQADSVPVEPPGKPMYTHISSFLDSLPI